MKFRKMHGLGNDFVMVNGISEKLPEDLASLAINLCDRKLGIGADGLIIISEGEGRTDLTMSIYNSDGSQAEMCGNGIRCAAVFANGVLHGRILGPFFPNGPFHGLV